jgi:hypothetical protein
MGVKSSYTLKNPISLQAGKDREHFTRDDLIQVIEKKQIERISFLYPALGGQLKQLRILTTSRHQTEQILEI